MEPKAFRTRQCYLSPDRATRIGTFLPAGALPKSLLRAGTPGIPLQDLRDNNACWIGKASVSWPPDSYDLRMSMCCPLHCGCRPNNCLAVLRYDDRQSGRPESYAAARPLNKDP